MGERLVQPKEWIPVFLIVYRTLAVTLSRHGVRPIAAGSIAYSLNIKLEPTKDIIDILLSKPLDQSRLVEVERALESTLRSHGYTITLQRIQLGASAEDWVIQLFVVTPSGVEIGVEVFNLLIARPASLFETTARNLGGMDIDIETLTLESWFASKLADPNGIDETNLERLGKAAAYIDLRKSFEILMRLSLRKIVQENAEDAMRRTRDAKLKEILGLLL